MRNTTTGEVGKADVEWEQTASRKKGGKRKGSKGDSADGKGSAPSASPPSRDAADASARGRDRKVRDPVPSHTPVEEKAMHEIWNGDTRGEVNARD